MPLANDVLSSGAEATHRPSSIVSSTTVMQNHSRFQEGSIDGITNPPNSPQPLSPQMSPSISPNKKKASPGKGNSPAKITLENIAEKVGIKATSIKKDEGGSPSSPTNKRRWRDVWRGGRKDGSKDDVDNIAST